MSALEFLRRSRGLTLRALGAASQIRFTRLHYAEHGAALKSEEYQRLAAVLGCDVETLKSRAIAPSFSSHPEPAASHA
jgi:transcriptional regulator with XRE-family HTH domain